LQKGKKTPPPQASLKSARLGPISKSLSHRKEKRESRESLGHNKSSIIEAGGRCRTEEIKISRLKLKIAQDQKGWEGQG